MSEGNQVALRYVPESVYGTTPADSTDWQQLCYAGAESLDGRPNYQDSNKICGGAVSRMPQDRILVSNEVGGAVPFEFNAADLDAFLEAAMCGAWSSDVLTVGNTDRSFTIEKQFLDLTNKYIAFNGMRVAQMGINFPFGSPATGTMTFAGKDVDADNVASLVGSGSVAAPSTNRVYNASADIASVTFAGVALDLDDFVIQELGLTINNNMRAINGLGSTTPKNQAKGEATINVTLRAFLSDSAFDVYTRALNSTDTALVWQVTDGARSYTFNFPELTLEGSAPQGPGKNQDVLVEATGLAKVTPPTITRVP